MSKAEVGKLAAWIRKSGAVLLVAFAALIFTRNPGLAIMAGMAAYSLFARTGWFSGKGRGGSSAANSAVRTPYLEMSLDHATGAVFGRVHYGRFAGRALSDFTDAERMDFLAELRASDAQGAQLFEAYLDRNFPGWGGGGTDSGPRGGPSRGMTVDEAYQVLGLSRGATRAEVQTAHRNLMKRFHPDQGGTTYLASQVNEAKDVLLKYIRG